MRQCTISSIKEVVACGGCRDRTDVGGKATEGRGVFLPGVVMSNLEVLSFFFGGDEKSVPNLFDSLF